MGDFAEAAAVTLFFGVGELFEHYAVGRSRKSIAALSEIRPDTANLLLPDGATQQVSAQEVEVGATLQILPFERIPLDGVVLSGESTVDASAITGESAPQNAGPESELLSGMINGPGTLTMRVVNSYAQSAASRIIDMVENAAQRKSASGTACHEICKDLHACRCNIGSSARHRPPSARRRLEGMGA